MFAAHRAFSARPAVLAVLTVALAVPVLSVVGVANAEDEVSSGDTVVGELVQLWPEYEESDEAADHGDEGPLSYVRPEDGEAVRVDTDDVDEVEVGATVELTVGREVRDTASEELGYEEAREVLETSVLAPAPTMPANPAPASPPFTNSVTVVMVVPAGATRDATTLADVVDQVNGPVADFWESETDGVITVGVTAGHDWINTTATCDKPMDLWKEAAAAVGFVEGAGKHLLLYVTSSTVNTGACSYGLAQVGASKSSGGFLYVRDTATSVIAHELGHNLSLRHSSALQCDGRVNSGDCGVYPYHDLYDVMGFSWDQLGSLNVVQTSRLVPVQHEAFELTSAARTVTIAPVSQRAGVRAAVLKTGHPFAHYWLEYRPAAGRDAWLATSHGGPPLEAGVLLRRDDSSTGSPDGTLLLDGTPSPRAGWDDDFAAVLPVGSPVTVEDTYWGNGAYTVTVTAVSSTGATVEVVPATAVGLAHRASGGDGGPLGAPTAEETCGVVHVAQYCGRSYQHGEIYWRKGSWDPAYAIHGPLYPAWVSAGGLPTWGLPTSDTVCGLVAGGCRQMFLDGGELYWSSASGLVATGGRIRSWWLAQGGVSGALGYPTAAAVCGSQGCVQAFQGGSVVARAAGGTFGMHGPIHDLWTAAGGATGSLGLPGSDQLAVPGGTAQAFDGGSVYWSAGTGAHAVRGPIRAVWWAAGGVSGPLGFPTGGHVALPGGETVAFSGGSIYSSAAAGTRIVRGRVHDAFLASGGVPGPLGFPSTDLLAVPGGSAMAFQGGSIYDSAGTGAHVVRGQVRSAWWRSGGVTGPLGFPTSDYAAVADGFAASFQGGSVYESATGGARVVRGPIHAAWSASGGPTGAIGVPTSDVVSVPGGTAQAFSGGSVYSSATTGTHALPRRVLEPWWATGGVLGPLGFPTTGLISVPGGSAVAFQGGSVYDSPTTGARVVSGALRSAWWATGGVTGPLGFPAGGRLSVPGGSAQAFAGGSVYSSPAGGTRAVTRDFLAPWWATGGATGPMGFPVSDLLAVPGGSAQAFARGSVYAADGSPAHAVHGPTRTAWWAAGGTGGALGFPTGSTTTIGTRTVTPFTGGLLASSTSGVLTVSAEFTEALNRVGGPAAAGLPVSAEFAVPGGRAQAFDRASVYSSAATGARVVSGPLREAWWASGGVTGPHGYPVGDVVDVGPGEQSLAFATGTFYWSSTTGTRFEPN